MLDDFEEFDSTTSGTTIHGRRGGAGAPVLLLHGIPETHLMWHRVAPARLTVLDIVPTAEAFRRADMHFSLGYWIWSFLAAPEPVPERLIAAMPDLIVDHMLDSWSVVPDAFPAALRAEYVSKFRNPDTVHAICEEYRAAATLDYQHDEADRGAGRRIACPTLALWAETGAVDEWYEPLAVWREWADEVIGGPIPGGHFLAAEASEETARSLLDFLTSE